MDDDDRDPFKTFPPNELCKRTPEMDEEDDYSGTACSDRRGPTCCIQTERVVLELQKLERINEIQRTLIEDFKSSLPVTFSKQNPSTETFIRSVLDIMQVALSTQNWYEEKFGIFTCQLCKYVSMELIKFIEHIGSKVHLEKMTFRKKLFAKKLLIFSLLDDLDVCKVKISGLDIESFFDAYDDIKRGVLKALHIATLFIRLEEENIDSYVMEQLLVKERREEAESNNLALESDVNQVAKHIAINKSYLMEFLSILNEYNWHQQEESGSFRCLLCETDLMKFHNFILHISSKIHLDKLCDGKTNIDQKNILHKILVAVNDCTFRINNFAMQNCTSLELSGLKRRVELNLNIAGKIITDNLKKLEDQVGGSLEILEDSLSDDESETFLSCYGDSDVSCAEEEEEDKKRVATENQNGLSAGVVCSNSNFDGNNQLSNKDSAVPQNFTERTVEASDLKQICVVLDIDRNEKDKMENLESKLEDSSLEVKGINSDAVSEGNDSLLGLGKEPKDRETVTENQKQKIASSAEEVISFDSPSVEDESLKNDDGNNPQVIEDVVETCHINQTGIISEEKEEAHPDVNKDSTCGVNGVNLGIDSLKIPVENDFLLAVNGVIDDCGTIVGSSEQQDVSAVKEVNSAHQCFASDSSFDGNEGLKMDDGNNSQDEVKTRHINQICVESKVIVKSKALPDVESKLEDSLLKVEGINLDKVSEENDNLLPAVNRHTDDSDCNTITGEEEHQNVSSAENIDSSHQSSSDCLPCLNGSLKNEDVPGLDDLIEDVVKPCHLSQLDVNEMNRVLPDLESKLEDSGLEVLGEKEIYSDKVENSLLLAMNKNNGEPVNEKKNQLILSSAEEVDFSYSSSGSKSLNIEDGTSPQNFIKDVIETCLTNQSEVNEKMKASADVESELEDSSPELLDVKGMNSNEFLVENCLLLALKKDTNGCEKLTEKKDHQDVCSAVNADFFRQCSSDFLPCENESLTNEDSSGLDDFIEYTVESCHLNQLDEMEKTLPDLECKLEGHNLLPAVNKAEEDIKTVADNQKLQNEYSAENVDFSQQCSSISPLVGNESLKTEDATDAPNFIVHELEKCHINQICVESDVNEKIEAQLGLQSKLEDSSMVVKRIISSGKGSEETKLLVAANYSDCETVHETVEQKILFSAIAVNSLPSQLAKEPSAVKTKSIVTIDELILETLVRHNLLPEKSEDSFCYVCKVEVSDTMRCRLTHGLGKNHFKNLLNGKPLSEKKKTYTEFHNMISSCEIDLPKFKTRRYYNTEIDYFLKILNKAKSALSRNLENLENN